MGLRVRRSGGGLVAQCPAHEDDSPSLSISEGDDGRALVYCHAGCLFADVLAALGLEPSDAFAESPLTGPKGPTQLRAEVDAEALLQRMALRDSEGEGYLDDRGLLIDPLPSGVVRFNLGRTGNPFVDMAAKKGFRIVFAVRGPGARVESLSFRHVGSGAGWNGEVKTKLCLKGAATVGVAIARPEVGFLATTDPEFLRDEVILCEGGTDWLAATKANDLGAIEREVEPAWVLGCVGASNAASVVKAFAPVIAGRVLRLWFDNDEAGRKASETAAGVAIDIGARAVKRYTPPDKDVANGMKQAVRP
jgi:hypothetical protein